MSESFSLKYSILLQIILLVLWYTIIPAAPAWVVFLPAIIVAIILGGVAVGFLLSLVTLILSKGR